MIAALKPLFSRIRNDGAPLISPGALNKLVPIVALAIGVTALLLMFLWRDQSSYKPVFGKREQVVAADMMAALDAENIPYRLHPETGQVLVPDAMLGKVRMLLASKGVVAKLPAGLELMDKNDPLGVSQFVQDVRFRRGLEGDLTQSILAIDAVETARVHLAIAKTSSFVLSEGDKSSASVVVGLKPGRSLSHEQIAAIINLVAGSVANLDPKRVSLVDQTGRLLSARVDLEERFDGMSGNEASRQYQEEVRRNVSDLLSSTLGENNYRVSVTAEVDNDRVEETHEVYGVTPKITTEALREERDKQFAAIGIPGSLSNRPIAPPAEDAESAGNAQDGKPDANTAQRSATSRQYAYDRNITQIKRSRGRLRRLNVAVVLNNAAAPSQAGGWSTAELANIEKMLQTGLGIDVARGDNLSVSTLDFPAIPVEPWWQERHNVYEMASWVGYAIATLLAYLLLVRPLLRILQQRFAPPVPVISEEKNIDPPVEALPQPSSQQALALEEGKTAAIGMSAVPLLENYQLPPPGSPVDVLIDHLKVLAEKEPERVAEVVRQWVQKNVQAE